MKQSFLALEAKVGEAAQLLTAMAYTKRLLVLCHLIEGEKSVGQLAEIVDPVEHVLHRDALLQERRVGEDAGRELLVEGVEQG